MKRTLAFVIQIFAFAVTSHTQVKCEANINGFKIRNVYVMGDQYSGVVWAYKHLSEESCLTPTTDLSKADAILEIHGTYHTLHREERPLTVICSSSRNSSSCIDSTGNELVVHCARGTCTSYYGPSLYSAIASAFNAWMSTRWYQADAKLYSIDHKILWKSEDQKGDWLGALWPDKVRLGTNSPVCKVRLRDRSKYKNFRHWATENCGIEFDPLVIIDLKLQDREANARAKQEEKDELIRNAQEAAEKQKEKQ